MLSQEQFSYYLKNLIQGSSESSFLLAVSGGVDSMVMLNLFINEFKKREQMPFSVAHINYRLRGNDSDLDQKLVEDFCKRNHIECHVYVVSEEDQKPKNSIQVWARDIRYRFFRKIQKEKGIDFLVTAHHLDDQIETFLINLSRGSGIYGLAGIPANENNIIRPLLNFSKSEIYSFAQKHEIDFREDVSNKKDDYLRNKIRHKITPELLELFSEFLQNFKKSISILSQTKNFVKKSIEMMYHQVVTETSTGEFILDRQRLQSVSSFVRFEILSRFGFHSEREIQKIFSAETGKIFISKEYILFVDREKFVIKKTSDGIEEKEEDIFLPEKPIIDLREWVKTTEPYKEWIIDKNKVKLPLKLRKKKAEDFFYPLGMHGRKKISKFLKDEKISFLEKSKIFLLCDSNDEVLGVLPFRQDRRFWGEEKIENTVTLIF